MIRTLPLLAAACAIAGCHNKPQEVAATSPDPQAAAVAAANVTLPPAITQEVTFRCHDQSLVTVDFFEGGTQVQLKANATDVGTRLTAPAGGEPFVAEGYSLSGTPTNITLVQPGKPSQTCRA